jgi:hypothetical protein
MKHSTRITIALTVALSGGLAVGHTAMAGGTEVTAKSTSPEITVSIWQAIDAKSAALKKTIDAGKLDEIHHEAFAIRDLVAALPAHSTSLPADKLAKVHDGVKFVATLAARLDATGDAKDMAGTQQNYAKLMTVLASLRSNYASAP